jgi:hypothetical protein
MAGRECYHCKQWVEEGEAHDCWTTTESALTQDLSDDLRDAWERLRDTAAAFGEQRIYASHNSIMFSRKSCYFFVRPKKSFLEVCVFSWPHGEVAAGAAHRSRLDVKGGARDSGEAPGRSRGADHGLASGSLRLLGRGGQGRRNAGCHEEDKDGAQASQVQSEDLETPLAIHSTQHGLDVDDRRSVDGFHRTDAQTSTVDLANGHGMKAKRVGPVR